MFQVHIKTIRIALERALANAEHTDFAYQHATDEAIAEIKELKKALNKILNFNPKKKEDNNAEERTAPDSGQRVEEQIPEQEGPGGDTEPETKKPGRPRNR